MSRIQLTLFCLAALLMPAIASATELELSEAQAAQAKLTTARVGATEHSARLQLSGALAADRRKSHRVAPVVEGMVSRLHVIEHARVRKGQVLVSLRSHALGQAQADYLDALSRFELAESERNRIQALWKDGIVAESRWLKTDGEYKSARAAFDARRRLLLLAGLSERQLQALARNGGGMAEFDLTSPIAGLVTRIEIEPGQSLAAGETALHVEDHARLWAMVNIPVGELERLKTGARAEVRVQARSGQVYGGRLESLGGEVNADSQTLAGRVVVDNADGLLRPGMHAEIGITAGAARGLTVPASAVFRLHDQSYVFKVTGPRRYTPVAVETGTVTGTAITITRGINAGDEIVSGGVAELKSHWQYQGGE